MLTDKLHSKNNIKQIVFSSSQVVQTESRIRSEYIRSDRNPMRSDRIRSEFIRIQRIPSDFLGNLVTETLTDP